VKWHKNMMVVPVISYKMTSFLFVGKQSDQCSIFSCITTNWWSSYSVAWYWLWLVDSISVQIMKLMQNTVDLLHIFEVSLLSEMANAQGYFEWHDTFQEVMGNIRRKTCGCMKVTQKFVKDRIVSNAISWRICNSEFLWLVCAFCKADLFVARQ